MAPVPAQQQYWSLIARQWSRLASPLRPCQEDVEIIRLGIASPDASCLLLGVTPELARLSVRMVAIDNNAAMIAALWSDDQPEHAVIRGDWLDMPFRTNTFDTIIGDGSLTLLSYPLQYESLFGSLKQLLKPGGKILLRLFVNLEQGETCTQVCTQAMRGQIGNFHAFKWRLSMALSTESGLPNICVGDTYETFQRLLPDRHALAMATGWSMDDIATIDVYRGSVAQYSYPTLAQVRRILPPEFLEMDLLQGSYELAERCPIIILQAVK